MVSLTAEVKKMLRFAVCDDEEYVCNKLEEYM
jgi:hypothetical protein